VEIDHIHTVHHKLCEGLDVQTKRLESNKERASARYLVKNAVVYASCGHPVCSGALDKRGPMPYK
jgi:hypothetical protein